MKKIISIVLVAILALSLAACGSKKADTESSANTEAAFEKESAFVEAVTEVAKEASAKVGEEVKAAEEAAAKAQKEAQEAKEAKEAKAAQAAKQQQASNAGSQQQTGGTTASNSVSAGSGKTPEECIALARSMGYDYKKAYWVDDSTYREYLIDVYGVGVYLGPDTSKGNKIMKCAEPNNDMTTIYRDNDMSIWTQTYHVTEWWDL